MAKPKNLGFNSELLLFHPPVTNVGVEQIQWLHIAPISQITEESAIDFVIPGSGSQYLDLRRSRLYVKAKIVKEDGSDCTSDDTVSPVNLWMSSLFSQVNVYLQQTLVSSSGTNNSYKSYLEVLLNYGIDAKESQCQTQLYYKDSAGAMDETDPLGSPINQGLFQRHAIAKNSAIVDMEGPIYADIFEINRYLINGVEVRVKLFPSKSPFHLMGKTEGKYKTIIQQVILKACKVSVSPDVIAAHGETIKKTPAIYPYTRTNVKSFAVAKGQYTVNLTDMFQGEVPTRVVIGFVGASAYSGDYKKNPYNFQTYKLEYLSVDVDGQSVPSRALQPNFTSNNYIEAYQNLFSGLGKDSLDQGLFCSRSDFPKGYSLYVFDLKSELADSSHQASQRHGNLSMEARFADPLPETINVIVYANFPAQLKIDESRAISF